MPKPWELYAPTSQVSETPSPKPWEKYGQRQPLTAQEKALSFEPKAPEQKKSFLSDFPIGATIGGAAFAIAGGGTPASIPLAGLGAAGGEATEQLIRRGIGLEAPKTSTEAALKIGKEGALGMAGEGLGRGAIWGGGKALSVFSKSTKPEAQRAIQFINERLPIKERSRLNPLRYLAGENKPELALLPAEATENRVLDILHNISESSLIGGSKIQKFKVERAKLLDDVADDIINEFGKRAEPDITGELFTQTINNNLKPSRLLANTLYNTAEELGKGAKISTAELKKFALPLSKISEKLGGAGPHGGAIGETASGDDLIKAVLGLPDTVDYAVAKELRSRLLGIVDEFSIANKKAPAIGKAKQFIKLIDEATETGLKEHNPEALSVWREANKVYREGSSQFDNQFLRRLIKSADPEFGGQPEAIVKSIFKPGAISNIRRAKSALGGPDTAAWRNMQSYYIQDVFKKSADKSGELIGANLENALIGKTGMGDKALGEIFKPEQLVKIKEFANALKISQSRQAEGTGRMFIQLTQAGAVLSLGTGLVSDNKALSGTGAAILIGPAVLSRALTNPALANILIQGVKGGTKSKIASGMLGRFLTDVTNMQYEKSAFQKTLNTTQGE